MPQIQAELILSPGISDLFSNYYKCGRECHAIQSLISGHSPFARHSRNGKGKQTHYGGHNSEQGIINLNHNSVMRENAEYIAKLPVKRSSVR